MPKFRIQNFSNCPYVFDDRHFLFIKIIIILFIDGDDIFPPKQSVVYAAAY